MDAYFYLIEYETSFMSRLVESGVVTISAPSTVSKLFEIFEI